MDQKDQQKAFDGLLREARGDLRVVERALVAARRDGNGRTPTYSQVVDKIRAFQSAQGSRMGREIETAA